MTTITEFIARRSKNPKGEYIDLSGDPHVLAHIRTRHAAILYVFTDWSAPSHELFSLLTDAISDSGVDLPVFVISYDDYASGLHKELGVRPCGGGETFWFRQGKCVHKIWGYGEQTKPQLISWTRDVAGGPTRE